MDHQEIFAIAHMLQTAKGEIPSDEFAQGFLQGIHYMEVLHEIRVMETPDPPKRSPVAEGLMPANTGPTAPEKKPPVKQKIYCSLDGGGDPPSANGRISRLNNI